MSVYQITFSPTGGTQKVARAIIGAWEDQSKEIDLLREGREWEFSADDLCVIVLPAFGGRIPLVCEERMKKLNGNGAKAVLVAVYGNRAIDDTLLEMKDTAQAQGFVPVAAVEAVAEHSIIRDFAAGRPDEEDCTELFSFGQAVRTALEENWTRNELVVPGNDPYRERTQSAVKLVTGKGCNSCGLCVGECPVRAISAEEPRNIDTERCIACMRCVSVCPRGARKLDAEFAAMMKAKMEPVCSGRKENKLYQSWE